MTQINFKERQNNLIEHKRSKHYAPLLKSFIQEQDPDIFCLQETRVPDTKQIHIPKYIPMQTGTQNKARTTYRGLPS